MVVGLGVVDDLVCVVYCVVGCFYYDFGVFVVVEVIGYEVGVVGVGVDVGVEVDVL